MLASIPVHAQEQQVIEKTACTQALGYLELDELKRDLLLEAQRMAVNELFGELIVSSTEVENQVLTSDQILASSIGLIRLEGNVSYFNGNNLAEVCVTIRAYVTSKDREKFAPYRLTKRVCVTNQDLTTKQLIELSKYNAIMEALVDYDRRLEQIDPAVVLRLLKQVEFSESGFVPETETYCNRVEGYVMPIEVMTLVDLTGSLSTTVERVTATERVTAAPTPIPASEDKELSDFPLDASTEVEFVAKGSYIKLNPAFEWRVGASEAITYSINSPWGTLTIDAKSNGEAGALASWPADVSSAPQLVYPIEGDFAAQVLLTVTPETDLQHAGMGIGSTAAGGPSIWVERSFASQQTIDVRESNRGFASSLESVPFEGNKVYLKVIRDGYVVKFLFSNDGKAWTVLSELGRPALPRQIRIFLFASVADPGGELKAEFGHFRVDHLQ